MLKILFRLHEKYQYAAKKQKHWQKPFLKEETT